MVTTISTETKKTAQKFAEFAAAHIAPLTQLHTQDEFPFDLWEKMSAAGLMKPGIPKDYSGLGGDPLSISTACHALVKNGNNLGIALSWLLHQLIAYFIIGKFGTDAQKEEYLPGIASGSCIPCFAVSEPKTGAHPKHLRTVAEEHRNMFTLNGEKTYLTNGPIADIFIVIAVTGIESGKKQFTAFILPKETKGLEVTEPIAIPFFKPAPHGGIIMKDCPVPSDSVIGKKDSAYQDIVLPFRDIEDAVMMGAVTGALEKQLILLSDILRNSSLVPDEFLKMELGKLKTMLDTAKFIAAESAKMADTPVETSEKTSLILYFRNLAREYHVQIEIILKNARLEKNGTLEILTNELAASAGLGSNVIKTKQIRIGEQLFTGYYSMSLT